MTQSNFGTGIGLHLSRSLVELHHGIIKAENREDGQGTRFIIRLPLGSNHLKAEELENPEETGSEPTISQLPKDSIYETEEENKTNEYRKPKAKTRYRVLIVEDDEEIRPETIKFLWEERNKIGIRNTVKLISTVLLSYIF